MYSFPLEVKYDISMCIRGGEIVSIDERNFGIRYSVLPKNTKILISEFVSYNMYVLVTVLLYPALVCTRCFRIMNEYEMYEYEYEYYESKSLFGSNTILAIAIPTYILVIYNILPSERHRQWQQHAHAQSSVPS